MEKSVQESETKIYFSDCKKITTLRIKLESHGDKTVHSI